MLAALLELPTDISKWKTAIQKTKTKRSESDLVIGLTEDERFMFTLMTDDDVIDEYDVGSVTSPLHTAFQLRQLEAQSIICSRCAQFSAACLAASNPEDNTDCMLHALASSGDGEAIAACACALQQVPVPADLAELEAITDPALLELFSRTDSEGSTCLHWAVEVSFCNLHASCMYLCGAWLTLSSFC